MRNILLFVILGIGCFSSIVSAIESNGTIVLDITPDVSIQGVYSQQSQFTPKYVRIAKVKDNKEEIIWESLIDKPEDINISVPQGNYKLYVQLQGHRTIWELDNNGEDYSITSSESIIVPLWANDPVGKEVLADAPWRVETNQIPILVMVKDADQIYGDYDLGNVEIYRDDDCDRDNNEGDDTLLYTETAWYGTTVDENNYNLYNPGDWYGLTSLNPSVYGLSGKVCFHVVIRDIGGILDPDGDTHSHFTVNIASDTLPSLSDWYSGDTHYHSYATDNNVEFGFPVEATVKAGSSIGLDWVTLTDHSFRGEEISRDFVSNLKEVRI